MGCKAEAGGLSGTCAMLLIAVAAAHPVAAMAAPSIWKGPIQCWTDAKGHRSCGDSPPPATAQQEREVLDGRGVTKRVLQGQRTPEQIEQENRALDDKQRQDAYDRYLLQTYQNTHEIEKARDDRLAILDGRLTLAQKALADTTKTLDDLRARAQAGPEPGDEADPALKSRIDEFAKAREGALNAIARVVQDRNLAVDQCARDVRRYQVLRGISEPSTAR